MIFNNDQVLNNNLTDNINLTNDNHLNNLAQSDTNQFMNTNEVNDLNLDINFENNLELNEQDMITATDQLKVHQPTTVNNNQTMQKDLFNFDQFNQRENVIRNSTNDKSNQCDTIEPMSDNQNILQTITTNSNDSDFMSSCSGIPNGCDNLTDQNYLNSNQISQINQLNRLNNAQLPNQLNNNDLLLSDTRNNIRNNLSRTNLIRNNLSLIDNDLSTNINANLSNNLSINLLPPSENLVTSSSIENKEVDDKKNKSSNKSKSYSCSSCNSKFSTKGNLMVHQRRHTGERPFNCDKCNSCFSTKGNLKRHIKAHSGEKPYVCNVCNSKFTEKKSLKVHLRRHTGGKILFIYLSFNFTNF